MDHAFIYQLLIVKTVMYDNKNVFGMENLKK